MKVSLSVVLLLTSNIEAINLNKQDIQWNFRPYGPYFKEVLPHNERAYGRPSDASLEAPTYGDSAGQHTGTLVQMQSPPEMDYTTGKFKAAVPTLPTSNMDNFGKGRQPNHVSPFTEIHVTNSNSSYGPVLMEPEDPSDQKNHLDGDEKKKQWPIYGDVAGQLGMLLQETPPANTNETSYEFDTPETNPHGHQEEAVPRTGDLPTEGSALLRFKNTPPANTNETSYEFDTPETNPKGHQEEVVPRTGDISSEGSSLLRFKEWPQNPPITKDHTDRPYGPIYEYPRDKKGDAPLPDRKTQAIYPTYGDVPLGAAQRK